MKNTILEESNKAIKKCFESVPFLKIREINREKKLDRGFPDLFLTVDNGDATTSIIVEAKTKGEPRYAREAANQLQEYLKDLPEAYGVFLSSYVSPEAARICKDNGIGYIDLAGNCFITFDRVFIRNEGNPNPAPQKGYLRSLYSPKSERILRVLLEGGSREWKTDQLSSEADVSYGLISKVKKLLEDKEWVASETVGFSLVNPLALLEDWVQNYDFQRNGIRNYYSMLNLLEIESRLSEIFSEDSPVKYCLTGNAGVARYVQAVRYRRVMAYVNVDIRRIEDALDLKPVESGFNVTLIQPYDEGVFYGASAIDGAVVASPIQLYLDLFNIGSRGEEAAAALLEERIKPRW